MNRDICGKCSTPIELCDCPTGTTYDLLRRQHEAIKVLREALENTKQSLIGNTTFTYSPNADEVIAAAEQALKDTEGL